MNKTKHEHPTFKLPKGARWLEVGEARNLKTDVCVRADGIKDRPIDPIQNAGSDCCYRPAAKPRKPHRFGGMTLGDVMTRLWKQGPEGCDITYWIAPRFAREVIRRRNLLEAGK